jgi:hypothetical protein
VFLRVIANDNGDTFNGDPIHLVDEYWQRLEVVAQIGSTIETDLDVQVLTYYNHQALFYVDGLQVENKGYVTTYCDGDLELEIAPHDGNAYFEWVGQRHATESFRTAAYRKGGRYKNLTQGLHYNIYPTETSGLGMPPINLGTQLFTKQEKSSVQSVKALPRSVQMTFHARRFPHIDTCHPESLKALHEARAALIEAIKPDLVQAPQPSLIRYRDGRCPMDLEAHYEAGLEWQGDFRDPYYNAAFVRFYCPDPYWQADSQDTEELNPNTTISGLHPFLIARLAGEWQGFGAVNFPIKVAKVHPNGDVYIGGSFTTIDGVAYNRIARWDGEQWNTLGPGPGFDDGEVRDIAFDSEGNVVIVGTFTTHNGAATTLNRCCWYQPSTNLFFQLNPGVNPGLTGPANAVVCRGSDKFYFIGGSFVTTTSGTTVNRIVAYDPDLSTWATVGAQPGLDAEVHALEVDVDGDTIYIGGEFTQENGLFDGELPYVCLWNNTSYEPLQRQNDASAIGADDIVYALKMDLNGRLYIGGAFTTLGFWDAEKIGYWSRSSFFPLGKEGDGLTGGTKVNAIDIDQKGNIFIAGDHTAATNNALAGYLTVWNGTRFGHLDVVLANECFTVASKFDKLFVGYNGAAVSAIADVQTVFNNGKATSFPTLDVLGPLVLKWLENQSTGAIIRMNLTVQDGERVLIDFRRGMLRAISEWRGNVISGILPDSDLGDFSLLPGDNQIAFLGDGGDGNEEASIRWSIRDWSFDDIR